MSNNFNDTIPAEVLSNANNEAEQSLFAPMLQGVGSNLLSQANPRLVRFIGDGITKEAFIISGCLKAFIENYDEEKAGLRVSTQKLLDMCIILLTETNSYRGNGELTTKISIPLSEYVALLGKNSIKHNVDDVRKRVKEDLETLYSISIEWSERNGKKNKDYEKMRIVTSQGIRCGKIYVGFSPEFADYLRHAYLMQYPKTLLKIDERTPGSYYIGRKLALHYSIDNNVIRKTNGVIKIISLLNSCPSIPTFDEVRGSDRAYERRIKTPFISALNTLKSMKIIRWECCDSEGVLFTEEQMKSIEYDDFEQLYIRFEIESFPDQTERLEARAEEKRIKAEVKRKYVKKNPSDLSN
jgi:hypothetical protein